MKSNKIAVIGLGAMGYGIATSLARKGWPVVGADTNPSAAARFADAFGAATGSAREAASGADVVILVLVNAAQCEAVLFGEAGALASTGPGRADHVLRDDGSEPRREAWARESRRKAAPLSMRRPAAGRLGPPTAP